MKLFLLFLMACFVGGMVLDRVSERTRFFIMLGGTVLLVSVYFLFDRFI